MLKLYAQFKSFVENEKGQTVIEYALITLLIAVAAVAGYSTVASGISNALGAVAGALGV
jgi:Flp pilus assembly pilin Flp